MHICIYIYIYIYVEQGRQGGGLPGRDPGPLLRHGLLGGHRLLQEERRLRPEDHGRLPERRPHGAEGGGVRLAPHDLRGQGRRDDPHRGRLGPGAAGPQGLQGRHLALLPDQGRADPGLGEARREPLPRERLPEQGGEVQGRACCYNSMCVQTLNWLLTYAAP